MDKNTWETLVTGEVKRILGDSYRVERLDQQAEENTELRLGIIKEGEISGIVVEVDEPGENDMESESMVRKAAEYLTELYQEKRKYLQGAPLQDNEFSKWKDQIVYVLERRDSTGERLAAIPHEEFLDMAVTFRIIEKSENPFYFRKITNADLEEWDITLPTISELARKNTPVLWPAYICICENRTSAELDIVDEISVEEFLESSQKEKASMYLLTNSENWGGAGCILYENLLKSISKKWEENIVIIPISVHETALIPLSRLEQNLDEWQLKVREANQSDELKEDVLSDSVYLYDRAENMIKIASSEAGQGRYFTS